MQIFKLFPLLATIFTDSKTGSITLSEAQRIKEKNKNEVVRLLSAIDSRPVHILQREVISAAGTNITQSTIDMMQPTDFDVLERIAELNAESSWLGHAINYMNTCRLEMNMFNSIHYVTITGIQQPDVNFETPYKTTCLIRQTIDTYADIDSVEKLIQASSRELLDAVGEDVCKKALIAEAKAAVYGKQLHEGFIKKLMTARNGATTESNTQGIIVYNTQVVAYKKEEFADVEKHIQDTYDNLQKERNMYMKMFKDKARELELEHQKKYELALADYNNKKSDWEKSVREYNEKMLTLKNELSRELASLRVKH